MANIRKPDNIHHLNGTFDVSRHGNTEDKPDWSNDLPEMPVYLDKVARKVWKQTIKDAPAGVIVKTDETILAQFCIMVAAMIESTKPDGRPFTAADHTQLRLIQQELGFTPISRGKIGGHKAQETSTGPRVLPR